MKLSRIMVLDLEEIMEMIEEGCVYFSEGECFSGPESKQNIDISDLEGYPVLFSLERENGFRRATEEEIQSDASDWMETDEYRNTKNMKMKIKNLDEIQENLNEYGLEGWLGLQDQGCIEIELI